jgi:NitT/TauT family transport system ATP-binding protein
VTTDGRADAHREGVEERVSDDRPLLELINLSKTFEGEDEKTVEAVKDFNLAIAEGEIVCLVGPSGCGKTTLIRLVAGLEVPTEGEVRIKGKRVVGPSAERGMIFQSFALFPWRTVRRNIEFGLELKKLPKDQRNQISDKYIDLVDLEGFENSYPRELSGGMQQRVGLARALANEPDVLMMDEPFGSLDAQTRNIMQTELLKIWERTRKTIIFITHSVDESIFLADRVVVLTARPASIKAIFDVDLPRPRDRASDPFAHIRSEVLEDLTEEVLKGAAQMDKPGVDP